MNRNQKNKLAMYGNVQSVMGENESSFTSVPALMETYRSFRTIITAIAGRRTTQEEKTTGVTLQKENTQRAMAKHALVLAGAVRALASKKNDRTLYQNMKYSLSELLRIEDITSRDRCQYIYDTALKHAADLAAFGIQKTHFSRLKTNIAEFDRLISARGLTSTDQQVATKTLKELFSLADQTLKDQVDGMMLQFEESHPDFYKAYRNARQIADLGGSRGSRSAEGKE